jgi:hypothetical protein
MSDETETAPAFESGEVADLRICNAVSRGMSMADARAKFGPKIKAELQEREAVKAEADEPKGVDQLREALTAAGVKFHPRMKETGLTALWEAHKADLKDIGDDGDESDD